MKVKNKEIKLYMKNQKGCTEYNAIGIYNNGLLTVLKGSKIASKLANSPKLKYSAEALRARNDRELINENWILKKDIIFKSPTAAGHFVCGYSVTGMQCWKDENKKKLKELV